VPPSSGQYYKETTQHIPEGSTLHTRHCENLKFHVRKYVLSMGFLLTYVINL